MPAKDILPNIVVKRIKEQSFFINEAVSTDPERAIRIEMGRNLAFNIDLNLVSLTIRVFYHYPEESDNLVDIAVQNLYEVPDLRDFHTDTGEIVLPKQIITSIVGLSISHTRAILATKLAGTVLQESLPAIINPEEVAYHFFPRMFETNQ